MSVESVVPDDQFYTFYVNFGPPKPRAAHLEPHRCPDCDKLSFFYHDFWYCPRCGITF